MTSTFDQECLVGSARGNDLVASVVHDNAGLRADAPKVIVKAHSAALAFDGASYILAWRTDDVVALTHITRAFDGASYVLAWRSGDFLFGVARISRGGEPYALATSALNFTSAHSDRAAFPKERSPALGACSGSARDGGEGNG